MIVGKIKACQVRQISQSDRYVTGQLIIVKTELKEAEAEKDRLIEQLREAAEKIKTLNGLIPICSSCKNIRDDKGYWQQVEEYIRVHSGIQFSHGICPTCIKKLYPDYVKQKNS